jgi:hypothetical protein
MKKHFMNCFNLINKESDEIVLAKVMFEVGAARLDLIKVFIMISLSITKCCIM